MNKADIQVQRIDAVDQWCLRRIPDTRWRRHWSEIRTVSKFIKPTRAETRVTRDASAGSSHVVRLLTRASVSLNSRST